MTTVINDLEMPIFDVARKAETLRLAMRGFKEESESNSETVAALCELTDEVSKAADDVLAAWKAAGGA